MKENLLQEGCGISPGGTLQEINSYLSRMVQVCPKSREVMNFEGFFLAREILILKCVLCPGEPRKSRIEKFGIRLQFPFFTVFLVNLEFALCCPVTFLGNNLLFNQIIASLGGLEH